MEAASGLAKDVSTSEILDADIVFDIEEVVTTDDGGCVSEDVVPEVTVPTVNRQFFPTQSQQKRSVSAKPSKQQAKKVVEKIDEVRSLALLREQIADQELECARELHDARMSALRAEHERKMNVLAREEEVLDAQLIYWQSKTACEKSKRRAVKKTHRRETENDYEDDEKNTSTE